MIKQIVLLILTGISLTLSLSQQVEAFELIRIVVSKDGNVEVGPVKVDPVPPSIRVLERTAKGEKLDSAINNEVKERVEDAKTIANAPQIQSEIENQFFEQLRGVIGNDTVDTVEVLNLPQQIFRATPAALVQMIDSSGDLGEQLKAVAGDPLLAALIQAKEYYKNKGKPIPTTVKVLLLKSFTPETLNNARYVVDDFGGNLPAIINKLQETLNGEYAVTVDNTIIFSKTPKDENIFFWAHELQHTVQYSNLGIPKFASEYTTNYKTLEDEANKVATDAEENAGQILDFMKLFVKIEK